VEGKLATAPGVEPPGSRHRRRAPSVWYLPSVATCSRSRHRGSVLVPRPRTRTAPSVDYAAMPLRMLNPEAPLTPRHACGTPPLAAGQARFTTGSRPRIASWVRKRWVILRHPSRPSAFGAAPHVLGPPLQPVHPGEGILQKIVGTRSSFRRDFRAESQARPLSRSGCWASVFTYSVLSHCTTTIRWRAAASSGVPRSCFDGAYRFRPHLDRADARAVLCTSIHLERSED